MAKIKSKRRELTLDGVPLSQLQRDAKKLWQRGHKEAAKRLFYVVAATRYHYHFHGVK